MVKRVAVFALLLSGCSFHPQYELERTAMWVSVKEDPTIETDGLAKWKGFRCDIVLKRYPVCLKHELRHCLEGNWHGARPSGKDCY